MLKQVRSEGIGVSTAFALPMLVARDQGFFADEGLDVTFHDNRQAQRLPDTIVDPALVDSIRTHVPFEEGDVNIYRACEWGQIRRARDSRRGGKIIGKRSSVAVMAIVSAPGSKYTYPQTLRNAPISVSFHNGNHYATLQMLEGFMARDEINVVGQHHTFGLEAVRRGDVAAIALTEPWLTVAEKQGFQKVIETHYAGSEIAGPELDADTYAAMRRAEIRAVDLINADKKRFLPYLIAALPEGVRETVTPDDFWLPRLRFVEPEPYTRDEFERAYAWIRSWDLIGPGTDFADIVDNRFLPESVAA
ncbi:ABC transporter substrate-binding protein [Prosthecomicrobium pneumaticum]|uniref:NitT/TauT family transport system substrate-binding protein n=1 Tax=Prosthecomicrobium pneumaticum TaxID=81895 RepID=A0A7W9L229_9HYPH|nr:ABC transporter substrate-binding protein [Prosthecomicrobium pneumaticum]MBB5753128.1 NitT/TauT family transport system substrate-binding protein [Prosthecomicrobium pneumaticum]